MYTQIFSKYKTHSHIYSDNLRNLHTNILKTYTSYCRLLCPRVSHLGVLILFSNVLNCGNNEVLLKQISAWGNYIHNTLPDLKYF